MIERKFEAAEGAETVGFSHGGFSLVIQTLDNPAGKQLLRQPEIGYFEQAVAADPKYSDAWGWFSYMYATRALHRLSGPWPAGVAETKEAVRRTLELDPSNAMAHAALGAVLYSCDWNWPEAEREFRLALQLNPNDAASHNAYSIGLMLHGRFTEALDEIDRAMTLDPLGYRVMDDRAEILFMARRYDVGVREAETVLKADPNFGPARLVLGISLAAQGRSDEAIRTLADLLGVSRLPEYLGRYWAVLARSGRRAEAMAVLAELTSGRLATKTSPVYVAYVYAALGDRDKALESLEQAVERRKRGCATAGGRSGV